MSLSKDYNQETAILLVCLLLEINRHVGYSKESTNIDLCHLIDHYYNNNPFLFQ
jgi:hypothetical protein